MATGSRGHSEFFHSVDEVSPSVMARHRLDDECLVFKCDEASAEKTKLQSIANLSNAEFDWMCLSLMKYVTNISPTNTLFTKTKLSYKTLFYLGITTKSHSFWTGAMSWNSSWLYAQKPFSHSQINSLLFYITPLLVCSLIRIATSEYLLQFQMKIIYHKWLTTWMLYIISLYCIVKGHHSKLNIFCFRNCLHNV